MPASHFHKYKYPVIILACMVIFGGVFAYMNMQTALFPEITFPKIKVIAEAGQQPIDQMAVEVTKPLEIAMKQVPGLSKLESTTSRGSTELSATMDWNVDIDLSKQRIESRINGVRDQLPPGVAITVEKMNPSILSVMGYSLKSKTRSHIALKQLALYTVKPFLSSVQGVSDIQVIGGQSKEYWVQLDYEKMSRLGLTPLEIDEALKSSNFVSSNGYLSDYRLMYLTLTDAQLRNMNDLKAVVVKNDGKRLTTLNDIATISVHPAKEYIKVNADGTDCVLFAVIKQPGANLINLTRQIEQQIKALKKIIPPDVEISPYYIQGDFVNNVAHSVTDCLWIGLLLALVVALLFLKSPKASAAILLTIPITLCLTLILLYATGQTFNIMTLGAIAASIGLIIDDAIVVVEQIHRTHEEHPKESPPTLVHKAIRYLLKSMVGSSLSTIVIFLPFLLMTGVAGAYFKVMTNTMIITLTCSFFATWLILPVIYLALSNHKSRKPLKTHRVKERKWVRYFIRKPWYSYLFMSILILSAVLILPHLATGFLPEMDEGSIVMDYVSPPGTTLEQTDQMLQSVEKIIMANPEVAAYSRRTGTQMGFFITEPNTGDYLIQLKKSRNKTTEEVIEQIRKKIEASGPALRVDFGQVIGDMLGDLMSSAQPVEVKIFGPDEIVIQKYAVQVAGILKAIPGTADVFDGITIAGPSLNIQPDFVKLAEYNISPDNFQFQLRTAMEGSQSGNVFDPAQMTPIRLISNAPFGSNISILKNMPIFLPGGQRKTLGEFARIAIVPGSAELKRQDLQNVGVVSSRLENRDLGSTLSEIKKDLNTKLHLPKGYYIEYGGAYAGQQQSFKELLMILLFSSLLVFSIILFLFRDIRVALIILLVAVMGIAGSYLLLFLTHTPLNVGSYTGLIMIVGIIGENAIFTYAQFQESLSVMTKEEALVYAISTRLRPKLMTALGAIIALLPLALGVGTGALLHQPLAISVIGGFLVALPLLLIVLPSLLNLIKPRSELNTIEPIGN
ncbi:MAG TPA: efflux RND transporter permease subunit [Arachidicoccus sp.]|nr:efflux RND transporter permease subunit [Arachidicoccus sp.]